MPISKIPKWVRAQCPGSLTPSSVLVPLSPLPTPQGADEIDKMCSQEEGPGAVGSTELKAETGKMPGPEWSWGHITLQEDWVWDKQEFLRLLRPRESNVNAFKLYGGNKWVKEVAGKHKGVVGTGADITTHVHLKDLSANRSFPFFKRDQKFKVLREKKKVLRYLLAF